MLKHARHLLFLLRRLRSYSELPSDVHLAILPTHYFYISHAKDVSAANMVVERSTHRLVPSNVSQWEKRVWSNFILLMRMVPLSSSAPWDYFISMAQGWLARRTVCMFVRTYFATPSQDAHRPRFCSLCHSTPHSLIPSIQMWPEGGGISVNAIIAS